MRLDTSTAELFEDAARRNAGLLADKPALRAVLATWTAEAATRLRAKGFDGRDTLRVAHHIRLGEIGVCDQGRTA